VKTGHALGLVLAAAIGGALVMGARSALSVPPSAQAAGVNVLKPRPRLPDAVVPDTVSLCGKRVAEVGDDGRLLNHFRYTPVAPDALTAPTVLAGGGNCRAIHRDMAGDFNGLLSAARRAIGPGLYAVSCHRTENYQAELFCGAKSRGIPAEQRAEYVAPPGFSEHHTGYSVDFGSTIVPRCNFQQCFATTNVGRWLAANAPAFGFEMSFPAGNSQGVSAEPWHWRWVGRGVNNAERKARTTFDAARTRFPAAQSGRLAGAK
jgi:zinc D-Ala-D-Ala carboxypeptidase